MGNTVLVACVVHVEDEGGRITGGSGFLVGRSLAVTCAHVVEASGVVGRLR
jgi:V8-like Glu-specific endopeptidase